MAARPQNIGIKAIEIYFPSQVRFATLCHGCPVAGAQLALGTSGTSPACVHRHR